MSPLLSEMFNVEALSLNETSHELASIYMHDLPASHVVIASVRDLPLVGFVKASTEHARSRKRNRIAVNTSNLALPPTIP